MITLARLLAPTGLVNDPGFADAYPTLHGIPDGKMVYIFHGDALVEIVDNNAAAFVYLSKCQHKSVSEALRSGAWRCEIAPGDVPVTTLQHNLRQLGLVGVPQSE